MPLRILIVHEGRVDALTTQANVLFTTFTTSASLPPPSLDSHSSIQILCLPLLLTLSLFHTNTMQCKLVHTSTEEPLLRVRGVGKGGLKCGVAGDSLRDLCCIYRSGQCLQYPPHCLPFPAGSRVMAVYIIILTHTQ